MTTLAWLWPGPDRIRARRVFSDPALRGAVYSSDAVRFLQGLKDDIADLVFLDPPFNLGKQYSPIHPDVDRQPETTYATWLAHVLKEAVRVLAPGGALYLYHLPLWALRLAPQLDGALSFRHWIAVSMKNGFARGRRLYPAHYALLLFTKGEPAHFHRPRLRPQRCRHCGNLVKDYGGYGTIVEKRGVNLSDIWDDLSPVRHFSNKLRPANELPYLLFDRILKMSGRPGGLYVDPFAGAGSGVLAAVRAGMRFLACDIFRSNCDLLADRLRRLAPSSRRTRALR